MREKVQSIQKTFARHSSEKTNAATAQQLDQQILYEKERSQLKLQLADAQCS